MVAQWSYLEKKGSGKENTFKKSKHQKKQTKSHNFFITCCPH